MGVGGGPCLLLIFVNFGTPSHYLGLLKVHQLDQRQKKIFSGTNSRMFVIEWIHDYLKTIGNHLPSELASPHLGNNHNIINRLNPERWFEKLWPLLISAENSVNLLSETDFFTSSSVRKRRGEEIEADVRRAIAERKRACMWKGSYLIFVTKATKILV